MTRRHFLQTTALALAVAPTLPLAVAKPRTAVVWGTSQYGTSHWSSVGMRTGPMAGSYHIEESNPDDLFYFVISEDLCVSEPRFYIRPFRLPMYLDEELTNDIYRVYKSWNPIGGVPTTIEVRV